MTTKECVNCGGVFQPRRKDARYCGDRCRKRVAERRALRDEAAQFWAGYHNHLRRRPLSRQNGS